MGYFPSANFCKTSVCLRKSSLSSYLHLYSHLDASYFIYMRQEAFHKILHLIKQVDSSLSKKPGAYKLNYCINLLLIILL